MIRKLKILHHKKFVAYYRVSTREQYLSHLGLDSQCHIVRTYIESNKKQIVGEFTDICSGKRDDRPELLKAIEMAKQYDATIIVATLDRLARTTSLILKMIDCRIKFMCADFPKQSISQMVRSAANAERERKLISKRVREALDAKRRRQPNWKPGPPRCNFTDLGRKKSQDKLKRMANESKEHRSAYIFIKPLVEQGHNWEQIARELNKEGYVTRYGNRFYGLGVRNIYNRFRSLEKLKML